ncbi:hypothetical protein IFR05_016674 [Cadophora sp. M221]|nr:hypothetical protein IFR05_016674 [Cadophora sp. M221]
MAPTDSIYLGGSWCYRITAILSAIIAFASTAYVVVQADIFQLSDSKPHPLSLPEIVTQMPPCIASCIFPRMVKYGCASSDYVCICETFDRIDGPVGRDTSWGGFQTCIEGCRNDANRAPSQLLDLCEAVDVSVFLPQFMRDQIRLHGRQFGSSSSIEFFTETSTPILIITKTSTQPWGVPASTSIQGPTGGSGTTTVLILAADTSISTFNTYTTLSAGVLGYTSTVTAQDSPAITRIFGIEETFPATIFSLGTTSPSASSIGTSSRGTKTSTAAGTSLSTITTEESTATAKSSGLSSAAKIGLGVAIPLVILAILLGIFLFFRRHRRAPPEIQETHDSGLPEHISAIPSADKIPPQHPGHFSELGGGVGVPVHEMDQSYTPVMGGDLHELNNDPASPRYELNADGTRATGYHSQHHFPLPPLPDSNPEPSARGVPISSSFPPPWENTHGYPSHSPSHSNLNSIPSESEPPPPAPAPAQQASTIPAPINNSANKTETEDAELRELEREMAQIRDKKERLQQLDALELREEVLRRTIEERRRRAVGGRA